MNSKQTILFCISFAILCVGCLFSKRIQIFDASIQSKWFAYYFGICGIGILLSYSQENNNKLCIADIAVGAIAVYLSIHNLLSDNLVFFWINLLPSLSLYCIFRLRGCYLSFNTVAWIVLLCSIGLSVWGLSQINSWESLCSNTTFTGPFDSCAGYALSLVLCFPFILHLFQHNQKCKFLTTCALLLIIVMISLSQSRMAWLSALTIGIFLFFCSERSIENIKPIVKWSLLIVIPILSVLVYFIRPESANGRLFIWYNCLPLHMRNPLFGNGYNTFKRDYMIQQADFFRAHPESHFSLVADNVSHPFNEYLHLLIQWGAVGVLLFAILALILITAWKKNRSAESNTIVACLLSITIPSCVSYPFCYPFTWIVLLWSIAELASRSKEVLEYHIENSWIRPILFALGFIFFASLYFRQSSWYNASLLYEKDSKLSLQQYQMLYPHLKNDYHFLYNYAVVLYKEKRFEESMSLLSECSHFINDFNTQMFEGEILCALESYDKSIEHFRLASNMCPSRHIPLYRQFEIMQNCARIPEALSICKIIIEKPMKVHSADILFIKAKCKSYYNKLLTN